MPKTVRKEVYHCCYWCWLAVVCGGVPSGRFWRIYEQKMSMTRIQERITLIFGEKTTTGKTFVIGVVFSGSNWIWFAATG